MSNGDESARWKCVAIRPTASGYKVIVLLQVLYLFFYQLMGTASLFENPSSKENNGKVNASPPNIDSSG